MIKKGAKETFERLGWKNRGVALVNTSGTSDSSGLEQIFRTAIANVTLSLSGEDDVDVFSMAISPDQITRILSFLTSHYYHSYYSPLSAAHLFVLILFFFLFLFLLILSAVFFIVCIFFFFE